MYETRNQKPETKYHALGSHDPCCQPVILHGTRTLMRKNAVGASAGRSTLSGAPVPGMSMHSGRVARAAVTWVRFRREATGHATPRARAAWCGGDRSQDGWSVGGTVLDLIGGGHTVRVDAPSASSTSKNASSGWLRLPAGSIATTRKRCSRSSAFVRQSVAETVVTSAVAAAQLS